MDEDRLDELTERAAEALSDGDAVLALALGDQIAAMDSEDATARIIRTHALLVMNSDDEAFREGQIAALLEPENDDAQIALALAAWRKKRLNLAQRAFEKAVELSDGNTEFQAQYVWFLASERGPRLAMRTAEDVLLHYPESATAWAALGLAQLRLHRHEDAEASTRKALEVDPENPEAQWTMIRILKRRGEFRQAAALRSMLLESNRSTAVLPWDEDAEPKSSDAEDDESATQTVPPVLLVEKPTPRKWPRRLALVGVILVILLVALPPIPKLILACLLTSVALGALLAFTFNGKIFGR